MGFSLLMSIYNKEKPEYFNRAMYSIWDDQVVKPNEIILVKDGPLSNELEQVINKWKIKLDKKLKVVTLFENVGLGKALQKGLQYCNYELIARMDTDDISHKDRFKKQLEIFNTFRTVDICGSWISEFDHDESEILSYRKVPESNNEIITFGKKRNPMNHPTVMYKKYILEEAGGYQHMPGFEDYYLWVRMMKAGAVFYNIQEALVHMRTGDGQIERRRGMDYIKHEVHLQKFFLTIHYITPWEFLRNIVVRNIIRIFPYRIIKVFYKQLLRA